MLHILSSLQYLYLAGRMNVANLPANFRQVTDSLSWTVLNFRAPWETAHGNRVGQQPATTGFPTNPAGISTSSFGPRGTDLFSVTGESLLPANSLLSVNTELSIILLTIAKSAVLWSEAFSASRVKFYIDWHQSHVPLVWETLKMK